MKNPYPEALMNEHSAYQQGYDAKEKEDQDLYEACRAQHNAIDILFARLIVVDKTFFPSKSGKPWEAIKMGNKAIAKVEK